MRFLISPTLSNRRRISDGVMPIFYAEPPPILFKDSARFPAFYTLG